MSAGPPPPPPHGANAKPTDPNLPPGKYDIFIIPPHSSGSGFLYLPSLQPNMNSFAAGFASALVLVVVVQSIGPALRVWWNGFQGMGNMGMLLLVLAVGIGAWTLGRVQHEGASNPGWGPGTAGGSSGQSSNAGGYAHAGAGGPAPEAGPPPRSQPHNAPPPHSGPAPGASSGGGKPNSSWHDSAPEPEVPKPEAPKPEAPPKAAPPPRSDQPKGDAQKNAWEKAREEMKRKEAERKAKEAEQKRKDDIARRVRELREKEARERAKREALAKEKAEEEVREKVRREQEQREKEQREKERLEQEKRSEAERKEKEAREKKLKEEREAREKKLKDARAAREKKLKEEKEAREKKQREDRLHEAREKELRETLEKEKALTEKLKREASEREASRIKEEARVQEEARAKEETRRKSTYAFSSVGERTNPWPNGKPPSQPVSPTKPTPNQSSPKRPPPPPTVKTADGEDEHYSYRPYDQPKTNSRRKSGETDFTQSTYSYAPSHSTSRTSPPPSMRMPYATKDPDKIVIRAVYGFMNQFAKMPASQLVSGQGSVTDGLILRVTTEGLFIDDDVRGVPQREWDIKAWTLKLVEAWCPAPAFAAGAAARSAAAAKAHGKPLFGMGGSDRGSNKPLMGDQADEFLVDMLRTCQTECRLGPHGESTSFLPHSHYGGSQAGSGSGSSEVRSRGLHILRATIRDQEGKRYVFVLGEEEGWKVAVGLQRLRRGTQVRQLGLQAMAAGEARETVRMLGWG